MQNNPKDFLQSPVQSKQTDKQKNLSKQSLTLGNMIEQIQSEDKKRKHHKKQIQFISPISQDSYNFGHKQKSKLWTNEQDQKFSFLVQKHGPDFQLLTNFFEKKSKNQLKNKYRKYVNKLSQNSLRKMIKQKKFSDSQKNQQQRVDK